MDWQDDGILLSARPYGETAAILEVFTPAHGRHMGVLPGGASRSKAAMLQPGGTLRLTWHARLDDHIGSFTADPVQQRAGILSTPAALHALGAMTGLLHLGLPERQPHPRLHRATEALLNALDSAAPWAEAYLRWEVLLLEDLGFGLDLTSCAVTGATEGLAYVSPRTGRAVSRAGAGDWAPRLLPLPGFILGSGTPQEDDLAQALALTGHFLAQNLMQGDRPLPDARARLVRTLTARKG